MSEVKRCPACGAQNAASAEWCTLCLSRFDGALVPPAAEEAALELSAIAAATEAAEPARAEPALSSSELLPDEVPLPPPAPVAQAPVRFVREGERVRWACPSCDTVNDIEAAACRICGTVMARLFAPEEPAPAPRRSGTVTVALSAVLPGLGHVAEGQAAVGAGRAVLYLWTLGISILLIARAPVKGRAVVEAVGFLFAAAAAGIWLVSLAESYRLSAGDRTPVVAPRVITWIFTGLTIALFVGVLIAAAAGRT